MICPRRQQLLLATACLLAAVGCSTTPRRDAPPPQITPGSVTPQPLDHMPGARPTSTPTNDETPGTALPTSQESDEAPVSAADMPASMQPLAGPRAAAADDEDSTQPTSLPTTRDYTAPPSTRPIRRAHVPATRPIAGITRVLIVSIDGLRPDLALRGDTPTIHSLMSRGSFTFWAQTIAVAVTLPSHTSMLTGYIPQRHGIEWNRDLPLTKPVYPAVPTLFEVARRHGYSTAMAAGKDKFSTLAKPGTLDWLYLPTTDKPDKDSTVAFHAIAILREHQPDVMFVHLPAVDSAGHGHGWASPQQMTAIHKADAALAQVLKAAADIGWLDHALIIVTADHGGAAITHGADDIRSRCIPWIAVGPGVRAGWDLTRTPNLMVNTEDTFATSCWVLGLPVSKALDGQPVKAIAQPPADLMSDSPDAAP